MTKTLTLRALDIPSVHKFGIGFDRMFDELQRLTDQQSAYPPYNILKINDNQFVIELAVAGFTEGEIEIEVEKNILVIKGSKVKDIDEAPKEYEYVVKNIANRDFDRTFTLAEYVEVVDAKVSNGILSVYLERKVPETELPKRIAISYNK
jgi:molecular chaperone IbpA